MDQLKIIVDPTTAIKSVQNLELPLQYIDGAQFHIDSAELWVYKGSELVASGTLRTGEYYNDGSLTFSQYPQTSYTKTTITYKTFSFLSTECIAFDDIGRLYVIETTSGVELVRYDNIDFENPIRLNFSAVLGESMSGITDIKIDSQYRIYLCHTNMRRIVRIDDMAGNGWITYGSAGSGVGFFTNPKKIWIDDQNRILITDSGNNRVVRIDDMVGTNWQQIGTLGTGERQFNNPIGLSMRGEYIYICDVGNSRIVKIKGIFGETWETFGVIGTGIGQFNQLINIYVAHDETIFVTNKTATANYQQISFHGLTTDNWERNTGFEAYTGVIDISNRFIFINTNSIKIYDKNIIPSTSEIHDKLSYVWTDSENLSLTQTPKAGYKAYWILNSGQRYVTRWFSINYWTLNAPIDEQDIIAEKPDIETYRPSYRGQVTADSDGSTVTCNTFLHKKDFWNGSYIDIDSGNNEGETALVTSWDRPDLTLEEALPHSILKGDRFTIYRSFQLEINSAWNEIVDKLNSWVPVMTSSGALTLAVDTYDFRSLHLYKSIEKISSSLRMKKDDIFDMWREEYQKKVGVAMNELRVKIDNDIDGVFDQSDNSVDDYRKGSIWATH